MELPQLNPFRDLLLIGSESPTLHALLQLLYQYVFAPQEELHVRSTDTRVPTYLGMVCG